MKLKLICPCGKTFESKKILAGSYCVGEAEKESGWSPVFIYEGGLAWLCPECFSVANKLAKQIVFLVKTEDFYFPSLLK